MDAIHWTGLILQAVVFYLSGVFRARESCDWTVLEWMNLYSTGKCVNKNIVTIVTIDDLGQINHIYASHQKYSELWDILLRSLLPLWSPKVIDLSLHPWGTKGFESRVIEKWFATFVHLPNLNIFLDKKNMFLPARKHALPPPWEIHEFAENLWGGPQANEIAIGWWTSLQFHYGFWFIWYAHNKLVTVMGFTKQLWFMIRK
jgi:hypothetical protein